MVVSKSIKTDLTDLDTKQRIMEVAMHLFALKGFDGASVREIAKQARVNVAAVNYHFKSKENLRQEVGDFICNEFRAKITTLPEVENAAAYALKVFEALSADSAKCVNQFKLILEADNHPCEAEPFPLGYELFMQYLNKELNAKVPATERLWVSNIVFSYVIHMAVMSSTQVGKKTIEKFFPKKRASIPIFISQLVETLIRDLNRQYTTK